MDLVRYTSECRLPNFISETSCLRRCATRPLKADTVRFLADGADERHDA